MGGRPATAVVSYSDGTTTVVMSGELDLLVAIKHVPEAVAADHRAGMNGDTVAKLGAGIQHDAVRHGSPSPDVDVRRAISGLGLTDSGY